MAKIKRRKRYWYAVFVGACPGVYSKYSDAKRQVVNFQGADMLKYKSEEQAISAFNKRSRSDYDLNKTYNWSYSRPPRR